MKTMVRILLSSVIVFTWIPSTANSNTFPINDGLEDISQRENRDRSNFQK